MVDPEDKTLIFDFTTPKMTKISPFSQQSWPNRCCWKSRRRRRRRRHLSQTQNNDVVVDAASELLLEKWMLVTKKLVREVCTDMNMEAKFCETASKFSISQGQRRRLLSSFFALLIYAQKKLVTKHILFNVSNDGQYCKKNVKSNFTFPWNDGRRVLVLLVLLLKSNLILMTIRTRTLCVCMCNYETSKIEKL